MSETFIAVAVLAFGIVAPAAVFGLMLLGVARYGHTAIMTASWTVCLALIAVYRYGTNGIDAMTVISLVLMLACLFWSWSYREYLMSGPVPPFRAGGHVADASIPKGSVPARLTGTDQSPDQSVDGA